MKQKTIFYLLLFIITNSFVNAQNLVPNPSFENVTSIQCDLVNYYGGPGGDFDNKMNNWYRGSKGSSDIWTTLNNSDCTNHSPHPIGPYSYRGHQYPRNGDNFVGFYTNESFEYTYREYVSVQLTSPLISNKFYKIKYFVSLADYEYYRKATNVDAYFSINNPAFYSTHPDSSRLNYNPQIRSYDFISDTVNWVEISGVFSPTDTMNYLTIGNFFDNQNTNFEDGEGYTSYSYYFLDDVSVEEVDIWVTGDTTICLGDTATLFANGNDTVAWAISSDTNVFFSTDTIINVMPTQDMVYWLYGPRDTVPFRLFVDTTSLNLGLDSVICSGDTISLIANYHGFTNLWSDSSTDTSLLVNEAGTYWLVATNGSCTRTDTINIDVNYEPIFSLGNDTTICDSTSIILDASLLHSSYLWNTDSTTAFIEVDTAGYYWVDVTTNYCTNRDSIYINTLNTPSVFLGNDTSLCQGDTLILNAYYNNATYLWENYLTTDSIFTVTYADKYIVNVSNDCGTTSDEIIVGYSNISVNLGSDTSIYYTQALLLDAGTASSYLWNDSTTNQTLALSFGSHDQGVYNYWVVVTDSIGCTATDTIVVTVLFGTDINSKTLQNIRIYPNPADKYLVVDNLPNEPVSLKLISLEGRVVLTANSDGEKKYSFNISDLPKGIYLLNVILQNSTLNLQVILK